MDFKSSYYEQIKKIVKGKKDVYIISKSKDELIEIPIGDNFIYFSNSPKSLQCRKSEATRKQCYYKNKKLEINEEDIIVM